MPHRKLSQMFEEYNKEYFDKLFVNEPEFAYLAKRYHALEEQIRELNDNSMHGLRERLKRHRIQIKDEAYEILKEYKLEVNKDS